MIIRVDHWHELDPGARLDDGRIRAEKHDLQIRAVSQQQFGAEDDELGFVADPHVAEALDGADDDGTPHQLHYLEVSRDIVHVDLTLVALVYLELRQPLVRIWSCGGARAE